MGTILKCTGVGALCAVLLIAALLFWVDSPLLFVIRSEQIISSKQSTLIYELNHAALAHCVREYAWPSSQHTHAEASTMYERGDVRIPDALWISNPARILVHRDKVDLEYGGALLHYGISIFPKSQAGEGTLKLAEGVWFYSENGRYPKSL